MIKEKFFDLTEAYLRYCLSKCAGRLIDVGCGHGNHSIIAKEMGLEVTGYDVRDERMPKTEGINWQVGNITDVDLTGYDSILASGILYHLTFEENINFFNKVKESNVESLIINTHFAKFESGIPYNKDFKTNMSEIIKTEGYYWSRFDEGKTFKEQNGNSFNNRYVCWFELNSLFRLIKDCGFEIEILKPLLFEDRIWLIATR